MSGRFTVDRRSALAIAASTALLPLGLRNDAAAAPLPAKESALRLGRDQPFNTKWRFLRGEAQGLERPGFDDRNWRVVDLPHDWSIEDVPDGTPPDQLGPFDKNAAGRTATGFAVGGEGWYRKHFRIDGIPDDARVEVVFDGIYLESALWLNGQPLARNVGGYSPFAVDLTPHLRRGGDNVLAVRVQNSGRNSRWYSGSGIYREVRVDVVPSGTRLERWGVGAWTRRISAGRAEIDVVTAIVAADPTMMLVTRLREPSGRIVAEASGLAGEEARQTLSVRSPRLWSPESPTLYTLESELHRGSTVIDRMAQAFGIRTVGFDSKLGMTINGTRTVLRGGCIHHDNGLLGACAFRDADERRIRLLKERGFNAVRSAHNIASRSLREACDRLGMLLIDEAFDIWHVEKLPQDFSVRFGEHWHDVIQSMVLPARNSPSVVMWSIGNEVPQRATDEGVEWAWKLSNAIKRLDQTRPVTAGVNGLLGAPMVATAGTARPGFAGRRDNASTIFLDVPGYNYRLEDIEPERAEHPERTVYASETFPADASDYARLAERVPYFLGEFVWTAMDYLGEAGLGAATNISVGGVAYNLPSWPWVNAWCGDIDLIGNQKAPSRYRDVVWGLSRLEMAVQRPVPEGKIESVSNWGWSDELQSWTWPGSEGKELAVRVYTSGDRIELLLNGVKMGERVLFPGDKMRAELKVAYAQGVLEAVVYRSGAVIARKSLATVGSAAKLRLMPERRLAGSDRQALHFIDLQVLDAAGRLRQDDKVSVRLQVDGPADLIGFGSANPFAVGSFQASQAQTFHGRALAILRARGTKGPVRLTATAGGMAPASTIVQLG
ncbi:MAG: glycoside hydrolase family 2 TIM barrel-domain containing protein [Novosphingobium sp.]